MKFDLIFCIASLHYVKNIKKAVQELFDRTADNGFLIFNYPNRNSMYWYRNWIKVDDFDQKKRFSLVLNGTNLLTLPEIESLLKRKASNFWLTVGEKSDRANMAVVIQK
jgi:SAM-dependent methyltransferase